VGMSIVEIVPGRVGYVSSSRRGFEVVRLRNLGPGQVRIAYWSLIHMNAKGRHVHTMRFPPEFEGDETWILRSRDDVRVFTGIGRESHPLHIRGRQRSYCFFWGLRSPIWRTGTDFIALRDAIGNVIEDKQVESVIRKGNRPGP